METTTALCPVPLEQQPLEEYRELQESWFFRWATLELKAYVARLGWVWGWSWLMTGPIAAASFSPQKHWVQFLVTGGMGATLVLVLVLVQLYLGWYYVRGRLQSAEVFYEESGWYDGQVWLKPAAILNRDRLIVTYDIQPILRRLRRTFIAIVISLMLMGSFVWATQY
jgi:hypothetical protein